MSHFNHLVLALPLTRIGELAAQAGAPLSPGFVVDKQHDAEIPKAIAAVAGKIHADCGLAVDVIDNAEFNENEDPREMLFGLDLHSTYNPGRGLPEADRAVTEMGGYMITPELWARVQQLKALLTSSIPGFAEAQLAVVLHHW